MATRTASPSRPSRALQPLRTSYAVGARLTRAVPPGVRYPVAAFGGALWWAADAGRRHNAWANYGAALGLPEDDARVHRVARRAFANYGRMLADFLLIGSLRPEDVWTMVTVDGQEQVDAALRLGRGAILALPHMGSWDMAGAYAGMWGYRIAAVTETFLGSLNGAVVETRSAHGLEVIPLGRSAVRAINAVLDENGLVALLCDLPHGPGAEVSLFGRRAIVPSGPAAIACRRGAPVVPLYCRRLDSLRYHVHVDPPIQPPAADRCRGKAAVAGVMQQVMDRFEVFIHEHPDQWYAFRRILH
jgi:phosphatidylinositol dimannoside acyltransferase